MALSITGSQTYNGASATTHNITLPSSIAAGELLVMFIALNGLPTFPMLNGWSARLIKVSTDSYGMWARIATGDEGATIALTLSAAQAVTAVTYRITGHGLTLGLDDISISTASDASTATPDPPNLTPSWGSAENLWFAVTFAASAGYTFNTYPTNYSLGQNNVKSAVGDATGCGIAVAARLLTATSEDPGTFGTTTAVTRSTYNIAIRPAIANTGITTTPIGEAQSTTSTATLVTGATITAAIGDWIVVEISADNNGASGVTSITSVTDSAGNTYTQRANLVNDPGVAAAGATVAIFTTEVTNALSGDTVTVNFSPNTAAKSVQVKRAQPPAGGSITFVAADTTGTTGSTSPMNGNTVSVTQGDTIYASLAMESLNNSATSLTGDADTTNGAWSGLLPQVGSTGTAATSMALATQFKQVTATGNQTCNMTTAAALDWVMSYLILHPVAAVTSNFGWNETGEKPILYNGRLKSADAFVRPIRDGSEFTTPTPSILGWYTQYARPSPPRKAPRNDDAETPQAFNPPAFGWFEAYGRPLGTARLRPSDDFRETFPVTAEATVTPSDFGWYTQWATPKAGKPLTTDALAFGQPAAPTLTTSIDWFEPFAPRPPVGKAPYSVITMDPQPLAVAPTLTTDIGWFEPYGRPGPVIPPRSLVAWDPRPFTLTTEIGWFEPYAKAPKAPPAPISARAEALQAFTAPPFGWFETFIVAPASARRRPSDSLALTGDRTVATVTPSDYGWLVQFGKPPPPVKSPLISRDAFGYPYISTPTLTTDIGWFVPFGRPAAIKPPPRSQWSSHFGFRPDLGLAWFEPYAKAPAARARAPSIATVQPPQVSVVVTFGWFEPYTQPKRSRPAPFDALALIPSYTPDAEPIVIPDVPGGETRNEAKKAAARRAAYERARKRLEAKYRDDKLREELEALAIRFEKEGITFDSLFADDLAAMLLADDEEIIEMLLMQM